jgi:hypothetical protein
MSIVLGLKTRDAAILLADSIEVLGDYSKSYTSKTRHLSIHDNWRFAMSGAADDTAYLDLFEHELEPCLLKLKHFDRDKIISVIKATIHKVHKQHIWPRKGQKPAFQSIMVIQDMKAVGGVTMLQSNDSAVTPVLDYACVGVGSYLAGYLKELVFPASFDLGPIGPMRNLGIFIVQQVKKSIRDVDGETSVYVFHANGKCDYLLPNEVAEVETLMNGYQYAQFGTFLALVDPQGDIETLKRRITVMRTELIAMKKRQLTKSLRR